MTANNDDKMFNLFINLNLNENHHSNFLKKLLNPTSRHGQGKLFLNSFLSMINVLPDSESWTVLTEKKAGKKGRIDLVLSSSKTKIIIENKINNAINQQNQLYRYWKNEIFNETEFREFCEKKSYSLLNDEKSHREFLDFKASQMQYRMIYLSKTANIDIDGYNDSIKKPNNSVYNKEFYPEILPMNVINLTYRDDIKKWLETCLPLINSDNCSEKNVYRLSDVINQYIEFIEITLK